jgi:putative glutamine amidotransferase
MKSSNKHKVYTSECGSSNANFLKPLGFEATDLIESADVVLFGGGADIDPKNYGEQPGSQTYVSERKEKKERADFELAQKLGKPCFGICRGFQLLCTLAGGKLIQHVNNHGGYHKMSTFDGNTVLVNSLHHQMINPYVIKNPNDYKIIGWTTKRLSNTYLGAGDKPVYLPWEFKEIEAAFFPKINSFGVQWHPEMMFPSKDGDPAITWVQQTFIKFFNNKL